MLILGVDHDPPSPMGCLCDIPDMRRIGSFGRIHFHIQECRQKELYLPWAGLLWRSEFLRKMTKEIDAELNSLLESMCLCGLPNCKGHDDLGGFIALTPAQFQTLLADAGSESSRPALGDEPEQNPFPPPVY